ncbi:Aromatic amino acid exporter YddG [Paraburkholderia caffeinitolerans]|uniref:Aromatic amino acid exporter YddG n=1 Tax=Paraburkholderia caffeinitolerans TaxID=1723730 RepID=A0A6J5FYI7_9BURK|nr:MULTISPECIES: aromatic amino acid DMT transporter YddG [Paraburkholderia]CAB3787999.1 Aromatic amino acid exporter YddG [Paraburkholderia caffeinitolerans]
MKSKDTATLIGLVAIMLWASVVALIRGVSESLGVTGGAAMMYTIASVFLAVTVGFPNLRQFPRNYLIWGSTLFVAYELCLSLSIGYADNGRQAIEVGMINYLWPTFTMVSAIVFNKQRATLLVVPGFVLSMAGIGWVLGGDQGIDLSGMLGNVRDNPLSYGLAFCGALIWAAYCTVTARMANGKNGVTPFFILVSIVLWAKYAVDGVSTIAIDVHAIVYLLLAAAAMGFGYAAWNIGILHGHATVLAGASYFIPVLSAALAAMLLHAPLPDPFWHGALMVCGGSMLCWRATRPRHATSTS